MFLGLTCFRCDGRINFDSINEKRSTGATIGGIWLAKSPNLPSLRYNKGIKAAIVVKIPKVTGTVTSLVPNMEASTGFKPD